MLLVLVATVLAVTAFIAIIVNIEKFRRQPPLVRILVASSSALLTAWAAYALAAWT